MTAFGEPGMTWPLAALWPVSVCGIGPQPPLSLDTLCRFRLPLCRSTGFLTSLLPPLYMHVVCLNSLSNVLRLWEMGDPRYICMWWLNSLRECAAIID